jgi:hypothetical protein
MGDDGKQKSKPDEEKKNPRPARVPRKIGEPPGNLRKREEWFRKRSGAGASRYKLSRNMLRPYVATVKLRSFRWYTKSTNMVCGRLAEMFAHVAPPSSD